MTTVVALIQRSGLAVKTEPYNHRGSVVKTKKQLSENEFFNGKRVKRMEIVDRKGTVYEQSR